VDSTKELVSASISSNNEPPLALTDMMNDVKQLHGDFDAQLEELGEISKVRLLLITFLSEIWSVIHVPIRCEATHSSHTYSIFDLQLYRCLTNFWIRCTDETVRAAHQSSVLRTKLYRNLVVEELAPTKGCWLTDKMNIRECTYTQGD